jgi:20S proteasome subunit alpha 6
MSFLMQAQSIGARSQSARTYLEDHLKQFKDSTEEEMILHSLAALKKSASEEGEIKSSSV